MVAPLEHRDTEPLDAIILTLRDQIAREKNFQESALWKIRLIEREIQYYQRQVTSFSLMLEVPREVVALRKENQVLDDSLLIERDRLQVILESLEEDDLRKMGQVLLDDLERELNRDLAAERQEALSRILEAYVDTGMHHLERCQSMVVSLSHRTENLENELSLSQCEESRLGRMHELAVQFLREHEAATYGDFRAHIMRLLGIEIERDLKEAIRRIPR
ncbi:MAG: hypothetical protein LUO93_07435 [Methanomicrobiales archaeon]|nr:hypothetical protein [Methanomicrobiales archaeon]